jgi:hypothetical protein
MDVDRGLSCARLPARRVAAPVCPCTPPAAPLARRSATRADRLSFVLHALGLFWHRLTRMPCVATAGEGGSTANRVGSCAAPNRCRSASPTGDAVCCGYAAPALERARLPPSALPLPYVMNELNGDDRVSRLRAT